MSAAHTSLLLFGEEMQLQASHHRLDNTVEPNADAYSNFDEPDAVSVEACWLT